MKYAETFDYKHAIIIQTTGRKAKEYHTQEETAALDKITAALESAMQEDYITEPELGEILIKLQEILRNTTDRYIMETFPRDIKTLLHCAESDLKELDPQRVEEAIKIQKQKALANFHLEHLATDEKWNEEVDAECSKEAYEHITECMRPYFRAFTLFGHDPAALAELISKHFAGKRRYTSIIKPASMVFPIDSVNHQAFEGLLMGYDQATGEPHRVEMIPQKKSAPGVCVYVSIFSETTGTSEPLDINDQDMLNLVYSYMLAGNTDISLRRILESYGEPKPTEKQLERAHRRLVKLGNADITIDCKEYAKRKKKQIYSIYKRKILDGILFEEIRNKETEELLDVVLHCNIPVNNLPLYNFAEMSGQITHVSINAALVTGDNSITDKTAAIRHILLERILRKHSSGKSGKIAMLSTIYEKINATTKTEKNRAREQVKKFMLEWVKNGLLYGFAFRKNGKSFDAVVFARTEREKAEAETENDNLTGWTMR